MQDGERMAEGYRQIPVDRIRITGNIRRTFDQEKLQELADSIRTYGVLEPLLVRPADGAYELVVGERRLRAARMAGLREVPCRVVDLDARAAAEVQLLENLQRQDLDAIEEAQALRALIEEHGYTQEQLAERLGKSQPWVASRLRLLNLPETVQDRITRGIVSPSAAELLVPVARAAPAVAEAVAERIEQDSLPVSKVPDALYSAVTQRCRPVFKSSYYPTVDTGPVFELGPCQNCPKVIRVKPPWARPDEKPQPWCPDRECWDAKQKQAIADMVDRARAPAAQESVDLDKLHWSLYQRFGYGEKPDEMGCTGCEHLRQARDWGDRLVLVCLKPKCLSRKRAKATREEARRQEEARAERSARMIEACGEQGWVYALAALPKRLLVGLAGMIFAELAADKPTVGKWLNARFRIPDDRKLGTTSWHLAAEDWPRLAEILEAAPAEEVAQAALEWLMHARQGMPWARYLAGVDATEADVPFAEEASQILEAQA